MDPVDGAKGAVLPIATRKSIKMELDHMTDKGIITPVREPTDWVNQISVQYGQKW